MPLFNITYDPAAARRRQKLEELGKTIYNIQTQTGPMAGPMPPGQERPEITTQTPTGLFASQPEVGQFLRAGLEGPYGEQVMRSILAQQGFGGAGASSRAFQPVLMQGPTGEMQQMMPVFDPATGQARYEQMNIPGGYQVAMETPEQKRMRETQAQIQRKREERKIETLSAPELKFSEKLGAEGGAIYTNLQKAAQSASKFIPRLKSLKSLASKVRTGTGAEIQMLAKRALGIDSANMEVLNAKLGELAQDILNQQTGTKTDFDFQNAVRQSASLGKTPEANAMLIDALIQRQQEAVNFGNQARKAYKQYGVKGVLDMRYEPPVVPRETPTATSGETYEQRRKRLLGK